MPPRLCRPCAQAIEPQAMNNCAMSWLSSLTTSRRRAGARYVGLGETIGQSGHWPNLQRQHRRRMVIRSAKPADSGELGHRFRCERYGRSCLRRHRLEVLRHNARHLRRRGPYDLLRCPLHFRLPKRPVAFHPTSAPASIPGPLMLRIPPSGTAGTALVLTPDVLLMPVAP